MKPRILDTFCKAGGAGMGYSRAGFDVVGADIQPQPRYPFPFILGDALEILRRMIAGETLLATDGRKYGLKDFDAIHASPPCQGYSRAKSLSAARNGGSYGDHPMLIEPVRDLLKKASRPYVIENVAGSPLNNPLRLYGSQFGLKTQRERWFELSFPFFALLPPKRRMKTPSAGNGVGPNGEISICGSGGVRGLTAHEIIEVWGSALGIDWMSRAELAEAIPPAYTEYIGRQLIKTL